MHHPPIVAHYCRSKQNKWIVWANSNAKTSFNGKYLTITQLFKLYIELPEWGERYEVVFPQLSIHNLIVGEMYIDVGGHFDVKKVYHEGFERPVIDAEEQGIVNFFRRGWFSKEAFRCDGEVTYLDKGVRKKAFRIYGHWNDTV